MDTTTTVSVDLAKNYFELAISTQAGVIERRERLSRARFLRFFSNYPASTVVMEGCGSAHYWARCLRTQGHQVRLLPAHHVQRYVRGNKTDRADAAALLEAARCAEIRCIPIKSVDQQVVQQLHRLRQQYQRTRTARVNQLRGCLREFGIFIPQGIARGLSAVRAALQCADNELPDLLRPHIGELLQEVDVLKMQIARIERTLRELTQHDPVVHRLLQIPGIGLLGATALRAAVGDITRFATGRELACWLGLTAREHSSGERRRLGSISKRGDPYLRTLLVHGARSALVAAHRTVLAGHSPDRLRAWALRTEQRRGINKATVAFANKLARIVWATWAHERTFNGDWQRSTLLPES